MKDIVFKLKLLHWFFCDAFQDWKQRVWEKDMDEPYCCNGNECGCYAVTNREMYENMRTK